MIIEMLENQELPEGGTDNVAYINNTDDIFFLIPKVETQNGIQYVFTVWVKADAVHNVSIVEGAKDIVTDETASGTWKRIILSFTSNGEQLKIQFDAGEYQLYKSQLEKGTVPSEWKPSDKDNTNKMDDIVELFEQKTTTLMMQTAESILQSVSENYYLKGETDELVKSLWTKMEEDSTSFNFLFGKLQKDVDDIASGTDARFEEIIKYIRFEDGNIILGQVGNELVLRIQHDKIVFLQDNNEVAYFTNNKLYVTNGEFLDTLQLGKFAFMPRSTGNLSFKQIIT